MKHQTLLACAVALAVSSISGAALAQSTGRLYDAMPPQNSSYVRVIAVSGATVDVAIDGKVRVRGLKPRAASPYMIVPKGAHKVQLLSAGKPLASAQIQTSEQGAYTVAFPQTTATAKPYLYTDRTGSNKLKSILAVYNLAPAAGTLKVTTADGKTNVFTGVAAGQPATLEVNPISVNLKFAGATPAASATTQLRMAPGGAYSVFVFPSGPRSISAVSAQNATERYLGN